MKHSILSTGLLLFFAIGLMTACSADPLDTEDQNQKVETIMTKSFSEMEPSDFFVTKEDLWSYIYFKSGAQDWNWVSNTTETRICFDPRKDVDVTAYPSEDKPSIYIVNYKNCWNNDLSKMDKDHRLGTFSKYPDNWEIISTDKRTLIVLAAGHGKFTMDSENTNLVGWVKDIAAEVEYLHTYSGDIKNAEDRYQIWNNVLIDSERIKDIWQNWRGLYPYTLPDYLKEKYMESGLTRSVSATDTSYHPVPGHYDNVGLISYYNSRTSSPHLTTTKWGEGYPYEMDELKQLLENEYNFKSYKVAFDDSDVNPYTEMITMIGQGIPSIVHSSGGQNNTNPYTFIVDGCVTGTCYSTFLYKFIPDVSDSQYDDIYATCQTATPVMLYGMNWGNNGTDNDVFFASSEDWHVASGDHSNREALLSFRMDGSQPGD